VNDEAPARVAVIWSQEGRTDLPAVEREAALQILHCIDRYLIQSYWRLEKAQAAAYWLSAPLW
jgi:hypothetical protein